MIGDMLDVRPPEEQDELDEPIRISWRGDARGYLVTREFEVAHADGHTVAIGARALDRGKRELVIKTEQEAKAVLAGVNSILEYRDPDTTVWYTPQHKRAYERIDRKLTAAMEERDIEPADSMWADDEFR